MGKAKKRKKQSLEIPKENPKLKQKGSSRVSSRKEEFMLSPADIYAIRKDIGDYFQQATPDNPAHNQGLARTLLVKYASRDLILEGFAFAVIFEFLNAQSSSALSLSQALQFAPNLVSYVMDMVSARGNTEAKAVLASIVQTSTDEDIRALAAVTLASPHFIDVKLRGMLEKRFKETEGTSCRMALAMALYQCGNDKQLKTFFRDGYLYDYEKTAQQQGLSGNQLRATTALLLMPEILNIVLEDGATNGRGFEVRYSKPWKRKRYN